jgi:phenylalanyl-tRNA synthetase beta chain
LNTFKANINRQQTRVRIFESGVCFYKQDDKRIEKPMFAGLVYGDVNPINWNTTKQVDFFDAKSDVVALCSHITDLSFKVCDDIHWLHPGQSAYIFAGDKKIGFIGLLHPTAMKTLQIKAKQPIIFEIELDALTSKSIPKYEKFSKFPTVSRDISFMVEKGTNVADIIEPIKNLNIFLLKQVTVLDRFEKEDSYSLSLGFLFSDANKTLEDNSINAFMSKIIKSLEKNEKVTVSDEVKQAYKLV